MQKASGFKPKTRSGPAIRLIALLTLVWCGSANLPSARAATERGKDSPVPLQFDNDDVRNVVRLYEELTGFRIVLDNFVQGKITVTAAEPVSRAQAIVLIEKTLMNNGFSLVEKEKGVIEIAGTGKNPRSLGLPIISDPKDVPKGERIISYLFKLRHLDPTKIQQTLGQYLSPPMPYTSFLSVPEARAVLVTDRTSVIRELIGVMSKLDIPPPKPSPSPQREPAP